jgi:hypothetical protein
MVTAMVEEVTSSTKITMAIIKNTIITGVEVRCRIITQEITIIIITMVQVVETIIQVVAIIKTHMMVEYVI